MKITAVLLHKDNLYYGSLGQGDTVSFGNGKKDTVKVDDFEQNQILLKWKKSGVYINAKKAYSYEKNTVPLDELQVFDKANGTALFLNSLTTEDDLVYNVPYNCSISVGRNESNDIIISLPFVSGTHFIIKNEQGNMRLEDRGGTEGAKMEDDEISDLADQIKEETRIVDNVPARLRLLQYNSVGFVGDRKKAINIIRNMLISMCVSHCFEDVRLVGIFDEKERDEWEGLKWLPHIWNESGSRRHIAFTSEEAESILDTFNEMLSRRKEALKESSHTKSSVPDPYYIFIFGSRAMAEKNKIMNNLFVNDAGMGVTSLFLYDDVYSLPHDCRYIVDVDEGPCAYDSNDAGKKIMFTPDPPISAVQFDSFARRMSAITLDGFSKEGDLPDGVTFLEGYGVSTPEELNVYSRWQSSKPQNGLGVPIGVLANGKPLIFDIHAKRHGPHGLVAGTTGAGKSECLMSWILSIAAQ